MANIVPQRTVSPFLTLSLLAITISIGIVLLLLSATVILSLIPIYLQYSGFKVIMVDTGTSFSAVYITNVINGRRLLTTEQLVPNPSSFSSRFVAQLQLSETSTINIVDSHFLPSSSLNNSTCNYNTMEFTGDLFVITCQLDASNVCPTQYCREKFSQKVGHALQLYSSLTLPFESIDGTDVDVSMILCKLDIGLAPRFTCYDNIQNQGETYIDCGGITCSRRCQVNQTCAVSSDCDNTTCVAGVCLEGNAKVVAACQKIQQNIGSASQLFYPTDVGYNASIYHYATSSTTRSTCTVQPGTATDVVNILRVIGEIQVPFAIKGGGHTFNPNFSSTTGILIVMSRFRQVTYHPNNETVDIGSGLTWDDVYQALEPFNRSVLGARATGVGVAGLLLGGGYGWKSNQYGLAIDTLVEYELITPNATIVYINDKSYPDIFFGLKGGFNNFGIVTRFTMRALPQTQVYGGFLYYSPLQLDLIIQATIGFQKNNKDPKAQIIGSFFITRDQTFLSYFAFYDAPTIPAGIFDIFTNIPSLSVLSTQSYLSLIRAAPVEIAGGLRGRYSTVSVTDLTVRVLQTLYNQLQYYNSTLGMKPGALFQFSFEPFISTYLDASQGGAYPHVASSKPLLPLLLQFSWLSPSDDVIFINALRSASNAILQAALDDGQDVGGSKQILYPNYALEDASLQSMYGDNVPRLQSVRKAWDPKNIMYLTGGFKF